MCARDSRRTKEVGSAKTPSVVGSKLGETSSLPSGRGFLKSVTRDKEGLRIADGALGDSVAMGDGREEGIGRFLRIVAIVTAGLIVLLISVAIAVAILSTMSVFEVSNVEADETEHVKSEDVVQLASVPEGTTLLRVDDKLIQKNVLRNPWVASVEIQRVFPDTLRLHVQERKPGAVVAMGSGGIAWLMGDDGVWIEPLKLKVDQSESVNDVALDKAASLGVVLICDVPSSVQPSAGSPTTDKSIETVFSISGQLSDEFRSQIACYSASSEDDISCILKNGVEVSLGSDTEIRSKESVAKRILEEYGGQVTYINVRIPSRPTYRRIDSEYVREGTGAMAKGDDQEAKASDESTEENNDNTTNVDTESAVAQTLSDGTDSVDAGDQSTSYTDYSDDSSYYDDYSDSESWDYGYDNDTSWDDTYYTDDSSYYEDYTDYSDYSDYDY